MVPSPIGQLTLSLRDAGVYGKLAASDGLTVAGSDRATRGAIALAAGEWLRVFQSTRNPAIAVACRLGTEWWVLRPMWDSLVDTAGRDLGFVAFAAVPAECRMENLPAVLLALARADISKMTPLHVLHVRATPLEKSGMVATALLTLALGQSAVVPTIEEAAGVAFLARELPLDWIALLPDQLPLRLPSGVGLIIGRDGLPVSCGVAAIVRAHEPSLIFGLQIGALPALFPEVEDRLQAVGGCLGGSARLVSPTVAVALWLARQSRPGRSLALDGLPRGLVAEWLLSPEASPEDLAKLADRIGPEHADPVRRLLAGRPRAAAEYLQIFPHDADGARSLLDENTHVLASQLADDTASPLNAAEVAAFRDAIAGAESLLSLTQLARLTFVDRSVESMLLTALERHGLTLDVALRLLGQSTAPVAGPAPSLWPARGWLTPFSPQIWLAVGSEVGFDPNWRAWWLEGVRIFVADGRIALSDVLGEGIRRKDADLLAISHAPRSFVNWVTTQQPVALPPADGPWPQAADDLLAEALAQRTFFSRVAIPDLLAAMEWVAGRDSRNDAFAWAGSLASALRAGEPAEPRWLLAHGTRLPRGLALRQIAAYGRRQPSVERAAVLGSLLASACFHSGEAQWLRALLLEGTPLGPTPDWMAADLMILLPLLDPVRDVVRLVLSRTLVEKAEPELLARVIERLRAEPVPPLGGWPDAARTLRADWVSELVELPGWEFLADPEELAGRLARHILALPSGARELVARWTYGKSP